MKEEAASPEFYKSPADHIHGVLARIDSAQSDHDAALARWLELEEVQNAAVNDGDRILELREQGFDRLLAVGLIDRVPLPVKCGWLIVGTPQGSQSSPVQRNQPSLS